MTLVKAKESERDTCWSEDKVKMTLVKAKASKNVSHKSESDTCESNNAQKRQLRKLTGIVI